MEARVAVGDGGECSESAVGRGATGTTETARDAQGSACGATTTCLGKAEVRAPTCCRVKRDVCTASARPRMPGRSVSASHASCLCVCVCVYVCVPVRPPRAARHESIQRINLIFVFKNFRVWPRASGEPHPLPLGSGLGLGLGWGEGEGEGSEGG